MMKQTELYQKVYRGHEMLGWYTIGAEVVRVVSVVGLAHANGVLTRCAAKL